MLKEWRQFSVPGKIIKAKKYHRTHGLFKRIRDRQFPVDACVFCVSSYERKLGRARELFEHIRDRRVPDCVQAQVDWTQKNAGDCIYFTL